MSDSDEDSLPNNIYTFQNVNTTISATGPNVNNTNITGLGFGNNVLTSTMQMPLDRQRYGGSNFDQRSMYYRRETSPMSLRSVPGYGAAISRSVYHNGMGTQRSMYNGRSGSPMSVYSNDTTASLSAADIVFAFNNIKFNKHDLRIIKEAYSKLIKTRQRKRIEKRRKLKLFLKGTRRKSGEDSGEQGSDSSISSDDCRSVRTTICKENIPGLKRMRGLSHFSSNIQRDMNHMTNVSHFTNNIKETSMFTDHTEIIKKNTLRNMIPINSTVSNFNTKERFLNTTASQEKTVSTVKAQNTSTMTQKERFTRGFLLPSQRFNKSISGQAQVNNNKNIKNTQKRNMVESSKPSVESSDSDQEEIFRGFSASQKDTQNVLKKRCLENEDFCQSNKKRNNSDSPKKLQCSEPPACGNIPNGKCNDFIFAKPNIPIKKSNLKKDHIPEKLLAKSHVPPIAKEIDFNYEQSSKKTIENNNNKDFEDTQTDMTHNSDTSMRPSFIKRKLFTQKLDVAEQKNVSSDNLRVNSPQNIYSTSMRERNKARKLVTSQSCLSREVTGEDNNVLDLIHKIVTPDQINNTHIANKTECINKSSNVENTSKWDVTAVIANCDNEDISDTYTDEEIFNVNHEKKTEESKKSVQNSKKGQECNVVVQKLLPQTVNKLVKNNNSCVLPTKSMDKGTSKKSVTDCVKSFWDTDFESDMEINVAPPLKNNMQQNQETVLKKRNIDLGDKQIDNSKKIPISKGTILTVRNCHKSILNNSSKSHRTPTSSEKIIEHNKPNLVVQEKDNKVGRNIKATNLASHTGKKKDNVKENVAVNKKSEEVGRKAKPCVDCDKDNPKNLSKNGNKNKKLTTNVDASSNKKDVTKNSPKHLNLRVQTPLKFKDCKNMEPKQADKVTKCGQKINAKISKQPVSNVRIQPKRKSKDKSLVQSSILKASNSERSNKTLKPKELVSKNTSINNTSTIMTRSRDKLSFNSSQGDYSMNLSNISNRTLRLRDRVQRNALI